MSQRQHPIPKRDLHFDFSQVDMARWHPLGEHMSHYFNCHSLQFPDGERFFINGEAFAPPRSQAPLLRELADRRRLDGRRASAIGQLIYDWHRAGFLHLKKMKTG